MGDARLRVVRQLTWTVGVEGAADGVPEAMLLMSGAHVRLTSQLREPVGRTRCWAQKNVLLAGGELGCPLEHHRGGNVDEPLDALIERGANDRRGERVVGLDDGVGKLVEVRD